VPSFLKNTAGGKAISGGALQPRGRRGNTAQIASYWAGGVEELGSYESIATTVVGSGGTTTISFASIPSTYKHLQIRVTGRSTGAYTYSSLYIRPNSDSASNHYSYHALYGDGSSTASSGRGTSGGDTAWVAQNISGDTATANNFGAVIVDILDYANTNKLKVMRSFGGYDNNGSGTPIGTVNLNSGTYFGSTGSSTEAITSITLLTDGNFKEYTHAALYGIKG
jgi:hypothetical protein